MFKHKYLKYKSKYLELKKISKQEGEFEVLDTDNVERDPEFIAVDELTTGVRSTFPSYLMDAQDPDSVEIISTESPRSEEDVEVIKEDSEEEVNIGAVDKLRVGREKSYDFSEEDFISMEDDHDKSKILHLKTLDDFDDFTELYGDIKENYLYIRWSEVANNYRGVFVDGGLSEDRKEEAFFEQESYTSWWTNEYFLEGDEVAIFIPQPTDTEPQGKSIHKPFRGVVFEEYQILEEDFVDLGDGSNPEKIVRVADHMDFDKFTNDYGYLKDDIKTTIDLEWDKIASDYKGFYIDKDYKMEGRDKMTFFEGTKYTSWMIYSDVKQGLVYIFK